MDCSRKVALIETKLKFVILGLWTRGHFDFETNMPERKGIYFDI